MRRRRAILLFPHHTTLFEGCAHSRHSPNKQARVMPDEDAAWDRGWLRPYPLALDWRAPAACWNAHQTDDLRRFPPGLGAEPGGAPRALPVTLNAAGDAGHRRRLPAVAAPASSAWLTTLPPALVTHRRHSRGTAATSFLRYWLGSHPPPHWAIAGASAPGAQASEGHGWLVLALARLSSAATGGSRGSHGGSPPQWGGRSSLAGAM